MPIPASVCALIDGAPHAHLTTLNPDGSPQVSVVWVGLENDELVIAHLGEWTKVKNIRREPRVALSMLGTEKSPLGLLEHLIVYGKARITEGGGRPLAASCETLSRPGRRVPVAGLS